MSRIFGNPAAVRHLATLLALAAVTLVGALTVFRAEALPATIDLDSTPADLTVYGDDASDISGFAIAAGDINGDGTDDLIIAARGGDPPGGGDAGETYVIYGGTPGIDLPAIGGSIDLNSTSADLTVFGDDLQDFSGYSVAAGDINGDGTDDLIIGAFRADPAGGDSAGETYVIYGGTPGIDLPAIGGSIDLNSTSADLTVFGDDASDNSGISVAAGDIDGDGTDDVIIGANMADPAGGSAAGETYVIYGGPSLPATIDLNSTSAGLTVYGDDAGDWSGQSVAAGDIDGDTTYDDLIIGAWIADGSGSGVACGTGQVGDRCSAGETYVIYGGPQPTPTATATATNTPTATATPTNTPTPTPTNTPTPTPTNTATPTPTATPTDTPTITPTPTPTCADADGDTGCDDPLNDTDDDGCTATEEANLGPEFSDSVWYDVFDVKVPAKDDAIDGTGPDDPVGANGPRNKVVDIGDALAVLFYAFANQGSGMNGNGVAYDTVKGVDLNGDTTNDVTPLHPEIPEGLIYDRTPGPGLSAGAPDGVIDIGDALVALKQAFVVNCTGGP